MASSMYFPVPRGPALRDPGGLTGALPTYSSAVQEKLHRHTPSWTTPVSLPIPGVKTRRLRILVPNPARLHQLTVSRFGRKRGPLFLVVCLVVAVYTVFAFTKRFGTEQKQWPSLSPGDPPTLVFQREDLQRIWEWEIASGHYPSSRAIPEQVGLTAAPLNPALPPRRVPTIPSRFRPPPGPILTNTLGAGPKRVYLDIQSQPPNVAYPPRPVSGSVADLDIIMDNCDFTQQKYVRDCLEVLRLGAGLDNGMRSRRGKMDEWKYIYLEGETDNTTETMPVHMGQDAIPLAAHNRNEDPNAGLMKKRGAEWEPPVVLPPPVEHRPYASLPGPCNDDEPRVFHMFWTGPFTDKPYLAALSFLFTQNLGLHTHEPPADVCRPQLWLWINPGPAAAVPNPTALHDMYEDLKGNPWASPLLHPRFHDAIKFKLWNTTEQLDGVPELKDEWRTYQETLFNSGGHIINIPAGKQKAQDAQSVTDVEEEEETTAASMNETAAIKPSPTNVGKTDDDDMLNRLGSKSSSSYDRLSVILSDMARFVLCHRFGGIYLDADTIFLRDWEELWGWSGAFAYRWSRLEKYNTAVLRMHRNSALGTFLFRTALKNGLDFHPMTVSRYTKDAFVEGLLLRLPDALFDSAWLNTEYFQRDRPPQPYFYEFGDFFDTPTQNSAAPQALGFDGFFKGAFSYHFHNGWWTPFDPSRNWPDLGPQFINGERKARQQAAASAEGNGSTETGNEARAEEWEDRVADDRRDLGWAAVLKRTFEGYIRGERPNMYGEWLEW